MHNAVKTSQAPATNGVKPNSDVLVSVSAIVPADAKAMETFVSAALSVLDGYYTYYELLLMDNGLPLELHCRLQELQSQLPNVRVVRLSRRYSTEVAMAAALDHCIGDYVVLIDPLEHPVALIPTLVATAIEGSDSVTAVPANQRESRLDRLFCKPVYRMASRLLGCELRPNESTFKIFSRRLVNSIVRIRSKNRYLTYLHASVGLHQRMVAYESDRPAFAGSNIRQACRQINMLANILVANTAIPLRFASLLGLIASGANLLYLLYIFIVTLVKSRIAEGWLTISLTNTTMFLLLFTILTILAGYVARILDESKEQPLYFVESETNSTVSTSAQYRLNVVREEMEQAIRSSRLPVE